MNRILAVAICILICSGCGKIIIHPSELRREHAAHTQFDVSDSFQAVAKKISHKWNECQPASFVESIVMLEDIGEARIEYRAPKNNTLMMLVDLHKQHNGASQVDIYSVYASETLPLGGPSWNVQTRTLEHGAKGLPGCP